MSKVSLLYRQDRVAQLERLAPTVDSRRIESDRARHERLSGEQRYRPTSSFVLAASVLSMINYSLLTSNPYFITSQGSAKSLP